MSEVMAPKDFNPKKIYEELIKRCKSVNVWEIRCIIEESWIGIAPFNMTIEDGIFICQVIAPTKRDAFLQVVNQLPVVKFLTKQDDE